MTNNILDIYDKLYKASDNIMGETVDYNRGFQDCVYLLKRALKKYEHINLHIDNKNLSRELYLAKLALDDRYEDRHILQNEINALKQQLNKYRAKTVTVRGIKMELQRVEINYNDEHVFGFYINTDLDTYNSLIGEAYVTALQKRVKHPTDIKARVMQFFRNKGFKCEAK